MSVYLFGHKQVVVKSYFICWEYGISPNTGYIRNIWNFSKCNIIINKLFNISVLLKYSVATYIWWYFITLIIQHSQESIKIYCGYKGLPWHLIYQTTDYMLNMLKANVKLTPSDLKLALRKKIIFEHFLIIGFTVNNDYQYNFCGLFL